MRLLLSILVGFLVLVGVAASVAHYLTEPYNPGFLAFPTITALHVILGGIYLALAPLQFVKRLRRRWLGYHRWAGRFLVAIGLVIGYALVNPGQEYLVLQPSETAEPFTVALNAGVYIVEWYSVNSRETRVDGEVTASRDGGISFTSPFAAAGPAVLYLKQVG